MPRDDQDSRVRPLRHPRYLHPYHDCFTDLTRKSLALSRYNEKDVLGRRMWPS